MIIYIGNKLLKTRKTKAVIDTLTELLSKELDLRSYSSYANPILRIADGVYHLLKYRNKLEVVMLDVFSSKNFYYSYLLGTICRYLRLPYVLFLHGGNLPHRHQQSTKLVNKLFNQASKIVTPSGYLFDYFKHYYPHIEIIPNTVDESKYQFKANRDYGSPAILYLRGFGEVYNPQMLIKALPAIVATYPKTKVYMLGHNLDGTLENCKQLADQLSLSNQIEFKGTCSTEEWLELSEKCNLMVSTPNFDNTPISVIEGMMLGLPVISTDVGGVKYLIENNKTGFLVEKGDYQNLANTIINALKNKHQLDLIAEHAMAMADKNYTWKQVKIKWINLFNAVKIIKNG